jgi:Flp pilus assembly pilin Flp
MCASRAFWTQLPLSEPPRGEEIEKNTMKNWIMNFIADERGAETTEVAITGVVVAGGAITGFNNLKTKIGDKQQDIIDALDVTDTGVAP